MAAAIAEHDITGNDLAKKTGLSKSTITAVRGGKSCSIRTAEKLVKVLGSEILEVSKA